MQLVIDTDAQSVTEKTDEGSRTVPLHSPESFRLINKHWVTVGWGQKYSYGFTWFGVPLIQLPEDVIRIQEVIYRLKPDVIVETGVAHGGSLVFYASLCKAMGHGRIVGIDIEIRPHNRQTITEHALANYITLIEGDSTAPKIVDEVRSHIKPGEKVLAILDSNHSHEHVLKELHAYSPMVGVDSYIVATDGVMADLVGCPRADADWDWNNPQQAAQDFAARDPRFAIEIPPRLFNESLVDEPVTYWPSAYLRRVA